MAQALAKAERYLADFKAFEDGIGADAPAWVQRTRREALARFEELGLPTARRGNEKWKYTSVVPIARATFEYPFGQDPDGIAIRNLRRTAPWSGDWCTLVFVDGRYSETLSTGATHSNGTRVANLAEAFATDGDLARDHLAQYAAVGEDGFTALNTAFVKDGAFIYVPDGERLETPLHLLFVSTNGDRPTVSHPRTLVVAGRDAKLTVIESYVSLSGSHFTNAVTEIVVGDGAAVDHYRLLAEGAQAFHVGNTRVHQGRDSTFSSVAFARGSALARNDFLALLDAPGSYCTLNGLYMTSGTQHIDNYINIDHAKPHTTSRLYYKGILGGKSRAIFGGTVLVRKDAQKADAQQTDKNLLLSDEAEVDSKPSLLIYADDVKCGHGAAAGNIDADTLFYMRSRGLDLDTASRLLIHGFASEIIEAVQVQPLRAYLNKLFLRALPNYRFGGVP